MKNGLQLIAIVLVFTACSVSKKNVFNPNNKYSPQQLQEDFSLLQKILKKNHPSLYWYATSDSVNGYFASTAASLQDSLTEIQFRNKVSWAINKIHCGHTTVRSSSHYRRYLSKEKILLFPLSLKVWDDSAVVINNLFHLDTILQKGTIITAINNVNTKQIIDSICQFIGNDGYSNNFKYQQISFNFPAYYKNAFGIDSLYKISYIDSVGKQKEISLKNFEAKGDSLFKKPNFLNEAFHKKEFKKLRLYNYRNMKIDSASSTAFMSINTFSDGKLHRFFRQRFSDLRKRHINNLVVDLRLNTGGSILSCTRLSQYLVQKPFHVADTVAAFTRHFDHKRNIKPWFIYWLSMHISGRKNNDGRIHFRYFENHVYKPMNKNHFDGKIYIITGGYTFSAATLVTGNLKGQNNVTVVGEETGGGAYGNSAMFLTTIVLPNTGVKVTLPLYRIVLNSKLPKNGRGILPDVEVKPSSVFIKMGVDAKLERVKELIARKNN